jgi:hypothetical protein
MPRSRAPELDIDDFGDGGDDEYFNGPPGESRKERRARVKAEKKNRRKGTRSSADPLEKDFGAETPAWKYYAFLVLMMGGALQMVFTFLPNMSNPFAGSTYTQLSVDDMETLQGVFFSGEPWLVFCRERGDNSQGPGGFFRAMSLIDQKPNERLNFGILDCLDALPSGKTTIERFNLTMPTKEQPQGFVVANGKPPISVPFSYYMRGDTAQNLLNAILPKTRAEYKKIKDTSKLRKWIKTSRKKNLVLLLNPGRLDKSDETAKNFVRSLADRNRQVSFGVVDSDQLVLSLEKNLPEVNGGVSEFPRLIFLKRTSKRGETEELLVKAKAMRAAITPDATFEFVNSLIADDSAMAELAEKHLALARRPTAAGATAKARAKSKKKERSQESESDTPRTASDAAPRASKPKREPPAATPDFDFDDFIDEEWEDDEVIELD